MDEYTITIIERASLPPAPLTEWRPDVRDGSNTLRVQRRRTEAEVLAYCRQAIQNNYQVTVTTPDGENWEHSEIVRRLNT